MRTTSTAPTWEYDIPFPKGTPLGNSRYVARDMSVRVIDSPDTQDEIFGFDPIDHKMYTFTSSQRSETHMRQAAELVLAKVAGRISALEALPDHEIDEMSGARDYLTRARTFLTPLAA